MKLSRVTILLPIFLACCGFGQNMQANHSSATPAVVRMKTLQNQVANQQAEIDALRLHLGKLQQELQDLTQMVVDQETDAGSDDDDSADDSGAAILLARSQARQLLRKNSLRNAHARNATRTGQRASSCQPLTENADLVSR